MLTVCKYIAQGMQLHMARSNVVPKPARSIGIRQHFASILLQKSQHLVTLRKHIAAQDQHPTPRACISQHHVIILHILVQMASIFLFGAHIYY